MNEPTWTRDDSATETLAENWLLTLRRERFRSRRTGKIHDYYLVYLADAVNVVALTPDRQVILVRQFRAGSGHDSLETPGGLLDAGEDPLVAGPRELKEETGYVGDPPVLLGTVWSNASILTSKTSFLLVTNARKVVEPKLDPTEEVAIELVPADRIPEMLHNGQIDHALAVGSLLWWLVREQPPR